MGEWEKRHEDNYNVHFSNMQNIMSITIVICLVFVIAKHRDKLSLFNHKIQINGLYY